MRRTNIFLIFLFVSVCVKGQFVIYGTDPSRIKWKTVKTPHYELIFPNFAASMAYRYALFLEQSYPYMRKTIGGSEIRSYPVILHPGNMLSNGLVVWAPRRMELITTPPARLEAQSWDKHLALHESRHVMQMYKLSQGIFRPLHYALGEQAAGIASVFIPKWFFEGDAVATETAMSNSGRGRLPEFTMRYRSQMLSGNFYSYDKWTLGSYKDYAGDYYAFGYSLASFARHRYGAGVWDEVTSRYTRRFLHAPPFSKALKHVTGVDPKTLFGETFHFLNEEWNKQDSVYKHSGFHETIDYITPETKTYRSYNHPQVSDDSSIIAVKTSLEDIGSLIRIKNGQERRLCYLGNINSRIILTHNRVYWTAYVSGIRWTHENYSELKYYDLTSRKVITITPGQRFLSPAIDGTGQLAAVSQPSVSGINKVVLLDIEGGKETRRYDVPSNGFVKELVFVDDHQLAAIVIHDEGLRLWRLNLLSGRWEELVKPTSANIASLTGHDGRLFFESGLNGTNNIYSFDFLTSKAFRLTTSRFGAFSPALSADGKKLFFSDYYANGYRIGWVSVDSLHQQPADFDRVYHFPLAETIAKQEQFSLDHEPFGANRALSGMDAESLDHQLVKDSSERVAFHPEPYRKSSHLFHIHSWTPFYYDATDIINSLSDDLSAVLKPGCMFLSQNMLSTMTSQVGWYYDHGYHHGKLAFVYRGWFPVIDVNIDYGGKAFDFEWKKNKEGKDGFVYQTTDRTLMESEARLYIPFNLTRNHYVSGFQPSVTYSYTNNRYQQPGSRKFRRYQYLLGELRYYYYRKLAHRDILPRLGYQVQLQYISVPFDAENFGDLYAAKLITYLPGLIRGHGLMLRMMYQYQDEQGKALYMPQKLVNQARGYQYIYQTRQKLELKVDYSFGLFCPDLSLGGMAYIKRLRSNLFYDLSKNRVNKQSRWSAQSSYGADLILDCHLFRLNYPLSLGVRVIKPVDYGEIQVKSLFSVSF